MALTEESTLSNEVVTKLKEIINLVESTHSEVNTKLESDLETSLLVIRSFISAMDSNNCNAEVRGVLQYCYEKLIDIVINSGFVLETEEFNEGEANENI